MLSKTAETILSNNTGTAAESRHANRIRFSWPLTHISHLTFTNIPAEPHPAAPQLTPGPIRRCSSSKINALLVIALHVDEERLLLKELVLFDLRTPVREAHSVRKGVASRVR